MICSRPLLEQGAVRHRDGACLPQSPLLTVGIGLRIWWVLSTWLSICSSLAPGNTCGGQPSPQLGAGQPLDILEIGL